MRTLLVRVLDFFFVLWIIIFGTKTSNNSDVQLTKTTTVFKKYVARGSVRTKIRSGMTRMASCRQMITVRPIKLISRNSSLMPRALYAWMHAKNREVTIIKASNDMHTTDVMLS